MKNQSTSISFLQDEVEVRAQALRVYKFWQLLSIPSVHGDTGAKALCCTH
jgi:hypothetical protein